MFWPLISQVLSHFVSFVFFVTVMTWISLAIGAAITFLVRTNHGLPKTFRGFLRFCFPREMFTTKTVHVDLIFYTLNRLLTPLLIAPLLLGSIFISTTFYEGLTRLFGPHAQVPETTLVWLIVVTAVILGADFATFYTHYLDHKIKVMWEFHKVHHSSEFLIPITNKRFHPAQQIFDNAGVALTSGAVIGVLSYLFSMPIYDNTLAGVDAYFLVNALSFYHLRHSHIDMSYGWLENIFLSPTQHHLHHSKEARHWDKNFGLFLSVWDRMFGTFLYSEPRGSYRLGLPESQGLKYRTVTQLYVTPLINIGKMAQDSLRDKSAAAPAKPIAKNDPEVIAS